MNTIGDMQNEMDFLYRCKKFEYNHEFEQFIVEIFYDTLEFICKCWGYINKKTYKEENLVKNIKIYNINKTINNYILEHKKKFNITFYEILLDFIISNNFY